MAIDKMKNRRKYVLIGLFILWFLYALTFTPSGDDMERIRFAQTDLGRLFSLIPEQYRQLNGRVVGNWLSFALMTPFWLRALVKAVCVSVIAHSLWKIAGLRSTGALLLTFVLVTAMPLSIHVQVYNWSSGFFNYTVPMALLLYFLARTRDEKKPSPIVAALLGFLSCLFVEHVTVFLLLVAGVILLLHRRGYSRSDWFWFAIGILPGVLVMFASPGYSAVVAGDDWYRRVPVTFSSLSAQLFKNMGRLGPYVLVQQRLLPILLIGSVFALLKTNRDRILWGALFLGLLLLFFPRFQGSAFVLGLEQAPWRTVFVHQLLHAGVVLFLLFRVAPLLKKTDRRMFVGALASWVLLYVPLLIVQPIGPRNFYAATLFLLLAVLLLLKQVGLFDTEATGKAAGALLLALLIWRGGIHGANTMVYARRDAEIRAAMAQKEHFVTLEPLPYLRYMHGNQTEGLENLYYYDQPGDLELYVKE